MRTTSDLSNANPTTDHNELSTTTNTTLLEVSLGSSGFGSMPPLLIFIIFLQQLIFVFAAFGNGMVIYVFLKYIKLTTATSRFIVSLAFSDCLAGISSGCQVFYFVYPEINKNMWLCFLRYQFLVFLTMASQITVTFTTFDRYLAICQHHSCFAVMTRRTTLLLILVAWLVAFVIAFCPLVGAHRWGTITSCKYNQLFPPAVYFSVATTVLGFGVLAFAMYIFILRKAASFQTRTVQ